MKRQISLKWFVVLAFLSLGLLLVIGYSFMSVHFFFRGMDSMIVANMEHVVESYLDSTESGEREGLTEFSGYHIAGQWQQMPADFQAIFNRAPADSGLLVEHEDGGWFMPPEVVYFAMRFERRGQTLFIGHKVTAENASPLVGRNVSRSLKFLVLTSLLTALALAGIIYLLIRKVSRPVAELGAWAHELDVKKLNQPSPDFSYPELNELAELIRTSLHSVQESLDREHRFLRHTSHELRTPISVMRSNMELLKKIDDRNEPGDELRREQIVDRIDRASLNMKHLTETLLWLSRDDADSLPVKSVSLDAMLNELVEELSYLLNDKAVKVDLRTTPYTLQVPEYATRIILVNLIRNAFQHTWEGTVLIRQSRNQVEIVNEQSNYDDKDQELGFGLGLRLIEQLSTKLGWYYINGKTDTGRHAVIRFESEWERYDFPAEL